MKVTFKCNGEDKIGRRGCGRGMTVDHTEMDIVRTVIKDKADWISWTCPHCGAANIVHARLNLEKFNALVPLVRLAVSLAEPKIEAQGST